MNFYFTFRSEFSFIFVEFWAVLKKKSKWFEKIQVWKINRAYGNSIVNLWSTLTPLFVCTPRETFRNRNSRITEFERLKYFWRHKNGRSNKFLKTVQFAPFAASTFRTVHFNASWLFTLIPNRSSTFEFHYRWLWCLKTVQF